uniref:Uncharacterized protein n=2 Tax=Nitrospirota TaxID=40117 RepID=A0A142BTZ0_9BACT|nr:hypothetical protein Mcas_0751 [Candidatus Magnetobacterium casensis]AMP41578.1 hypothetical protein [uncultured Nitrospirota bacterium]
MSLSSKNIASGVFAPDRSTEPPSVRLDIISDINDTTTVGAITVMLFFISFKLSIKINLMSIIVIY